MGNRKSPKKQTMAMIGFYKPTQHFSMTIHVKKTWSLTNC